jgi:hypothetical protein
MATNVDVKWPSENEEFDTTTAGNSSATAVAEKPEEPSLSSQTDTTPEAAVAAPEESAAEAAPAEDTPAPADDNPAPVEPAGTPPTAVTSTAAPAHKGNFLRLLLELVLLAAVIGLALWGLGLQSRNKDLQKQVDTLNSNPAIVEQRKTQELVSKVSAVMEVPKNEAPTARLVSDAAAFKKQNPTFTNVQKGDELLVYPNNNLFIFYRPSTNKIVQTGQLVVSQPASAATTSSTSKTSTR